MSTPSLLRQRSSRLALATLAALAALPGCKGGGSGAPDSSAPQPGPLPSAPANALPIPVASIEKSVNPNNLPVYSGPTGSVEGTVLVDGPPAPDKTGVDFSSCPEAQRTYQKAFREGPPGADGNRPLADALVAVTGYSGYYLPERNQVTSITIENCAFSTRTVAMTFGQRLEIANKTSTLWAPSLSQAPLPALMMATSHGDPVRLYPPKPGYFTLVDNLKHPFAMADVYALDFPLHTVSELSGHYRIDGVPVGKMKLWARLAALGNEPSTANESSAEVEVRANVVQKVDLVLHYAPRPAAAAEDGGNPRAHVIH